MLSTLPSARNNQGCAAQQKGNIPVGRLQGPTMEDPERRVERVLEEGLERISTPEAAHAVVSKLERLSAGHTEAEQGEVAAEKTAGTTDAASAAAGTVERAASTQDGKPPESAVADVLK